MDSSDLYAEYTAGSFIDAKDSVQSWCIARVVAKSDHSITVGFDGWSSKWDETYAIKSSKLAPFRKNSILYTGQTKTAIREWWNFSTDELEELTEKINEVLANDLLLPTAWEVTQFYRGQIFTLVDCLLVNSYLRDEKPVALQFFTKVLELIYAWLSKFPLLVEAYEEGFKKPELMFTDPKVALANSWPEIMATLGRLFAAGDQRVRKFFASENDLQTPGYSRATAKYTDGQNLKSATMLYLVEEFYKMGGFDLILSIVGSSEVPFKFLSEIPTRASRCLNEECRSTFMAKYKEAIINRVSNISNTDIKTIDKEEISKILEKITVSEDDSEVIENLELSLALKFIQCPFMEKRLKGINEVKDMIERISLPQRPAHTVAYQSINYMRTIPQLKPTKWLNRERLSDWLMSTNLVEMLLKEYVHVEVIKRLPVLIKLLAGQDKLEIGILDLLWETADGQHDSIVRAIYACIIDISFHLSDEQKDYIFNKLVNAPEWDEKLINTLKEFSMSSTITTDNTYALTYFYDHVVEHSNPANHEHELLAICEILKSPNFKKSRTEYITKAIDNIKEDKAVPQSLTMLTALFESFYAGNDYRASYSSNNRSSVLGKLNDENSLLEMVIANTVNLVEEARNNGLNAENPHETQIKDTGYSYGQHLSIRFEFLAYIILNSTKISLDLNDIDKIWPIFVSNPVTKEDSVLFYDFLNKKYQYHTQVFRVLNEDIIQNVFKEFICNPEKFPLKQVNTDSYKCFIKVFKAINSADYSIAMNHNKQVKRKSEKLVGLDCLKALVLETPDMGVKKEALDFLIDLHLNLSGMLVQRKFQLWQGFINGNLELIKNSRDNDEHISRILDILLRFLDRYEGSGDAYAPPDSSGIHVYHILLDVNWKQQGIKKQLQINSNYTVGQVRKAISESFKIPLNEVILKISGNRTLEMEHDNYPIRYHGQIRSIDIKQKISDEPNPKQTISDNEESLDLLLDLLSQTDKTYAILAWNLITRLPTNEKIKTELMTMDCVQTSEDWLVLLNPNSFHKLLYELIIAEELATGEEANLWLDTFCQKGGPQHLLNVFNSVETETTLDYHLLQRYFAVVLNLLNIVFERYAPKSVDRSTVRLPFEFDIDLMVTKIMTCFSLVGQVSGDQVVSEVSDESLKKIARSGKGLIILLANISPQADMVNQVLTSWGGLDDLIRFCLVEQNSVSFGKEMAGSMYEIAFDQRIALSGVLVAKLRALLDYVIALEKFMPIGYFKLLQIMVQKMNDVPDISPDIAKLFKALQDRPAEKNGQEQDRIFTGLLDLLDGYVKQTPNENTQKLTNFVLYNCLFDIPTFKESGKPKCKNSLTRSSAFNVLKTLMNNPANMTGVITYLDSFHVDPNWRTKRYVDWNISPGSMEKSETGFVGMKNLGCICYLNSQIQQLFMIPGFRNAILDVETQEEEETPLEENLMYQLQYIFASLKESAKQYVNPKDFCKAFKDWDGIPINVMEQMDAEEFFNQFIDKLEGFTSNGKHKNLIKNYFGGKIVNEIRGKGSCKCRSEREEPLIHIQLEVKNKRSINESLESFIEGELLEKDNAYACEHCDEKVTAERRQCIKKLPNVLIIVLRRFEYDYDTMTRQKLNDYLEFPWELDMKPYTQEGLDLKESEQAEEGEKKPVVDDRPEYPPEYYNFKLKGVVVHMGTADSGHYYSFIKDRQADTDQWYEFNDTLVSTFDPEDMAGEAFGGEERWTWTSYGGMGNAMTSVREKYRNAYLLFYERDVFYDPLSTENELNPLVEPEPSQEMPKVIEYIAGGVKVENERYWRSRNTFSPECFNFVVNLWQDFQTNEQFNENLFKFVVNFYLTVVLRSKERSRAYELLRHVRKHITPSLANWVLEVFTHEAVQKELLIECMVHEARRFIVVLLDLCAQSADEEFKLRLLTSLVNNINTLIKAKTTKYYTQYCQAIYVTVKSLTADDPILKPIGKIILYYLIGLPNAPELPEVEIVFPDSHLGYTADYKPQETSYERFIYMESGSQSNPVSKHHLLMALSILLPSLDADDLQLIGQENVMKKIADISQKSVSSKVVSKSVSSLYLQLNDEEVVVNYIQVLVSFLNDRDYDEQKNFLRQLRNVLTKENDNRKSRIDIGMLHFVEMLKTNNRFFKATETCLDYFFKLVAVCPQIQEWATANLKKFNWIGDWLQENQTPPMSYTQSKVRLYKSGSVHWSTGASGGNYKQIYLDRRARITSIMKGEQITLKEFDSDEDMTERDVRVGDNVWCCDPSGQRYVKARVSKRIGSMLEVTYEEFSNKYNKWVDIEHEYLASYS